MTDVMCQRCGKRPGARWDGTGGFTLLCGGCKLHVTLEKPGVKERLEALGAAAMAALESDRKGKA